MKTEWQFFFEAHGFRFEKAHRFKGSFHIDASPRGQAGPSTSECEIAISPDLGKTVSSLCQTGQLLLTFKGTPEETENLAHWFAGILAEYISFHYRRFSLRGGLVFAKRIPESDAEAKEIGEGVYSATATLQEVGETPIFDPSILGNLHFDSDLERVLRQFTQARDAQAVVDRYLGLFKTLELLFCGHVRGSNTLPCLRASEELIEIAEQQLVVTPEGKEGVPSREHVNRLLGDMVRVRGNCAHLRERSGYAPGDPRLRSQVEPFAAIAEDLAAAAIRRRLSRTDHGNKIADV